MCKDIKRLYWEQKRYYCQTLGRHWVELKESLLLDFSVPLHCTSRIMSPPHLKLVVLKPKQWLTRPLGLYFFLFPTFEFSRHKGFLWENRQASSRLRAFISGFFLQLPIDWFLCLLLCLNATFEMRLLWLPYGISQPPIFNICNPPLTCLIFFPMHFHLQTHHVIPLFTMSIWLLFIFLTRL